MEDQPKKPIDPGATMQIDAFVDDMEDLGGVSRPPPLPPKKPSKAVWIVGVLVVLLMAGLGATLGLFFFGIIGEEEPPPAAVIPPPPPQPAPPAAEPAQPSENVVQMDEIVFDEPAPSTP